MKEELALTADEQKVVDEFKKIFYKHWNYYPRTWLGTHIVKYPTDLFLYQMIIHENKPDFIIETGSFLGGGSLFFATMCDLIGHGQVIGIDKRRVRNAKHERINYIVGRSTSTEVLDLVNKLVGGRTCMAVLDSDHRKVQVQRELANYSKFVTVGQYLVAEDTYLGYDVPDWKYGKDDAPLEAVKWFMRDNDNFVIDQLEMHYLVSMSPNGWLRRVK